MPYLLQTPSVFVFELAREGTVADAGTVGFDDADHTLDCGRWTTEARAAAAYSGMSRRDARIRAEIDVETRAMRSFSQSALALLECVAVIASGSGDIRR